MQCGPAQEDVGADPTFHHFTFDGGSILYGRNLPSVFSFGNNRVTITQAGGSVVSTNGTNRDVWFNGGVWTGSGELTFSHPTASTSTSTATETLQTFRLTNTNLSNFTGTFTAADKAIFELTQAITTPTFSLKLLGDSRYDNIGDNDILIRSLVIAGAELPPGTYRIGNGSLTTQQEKPTYSPQQRSRSHPARLPAPFLTPTVTVSTTSSKSAIRVSISQNFKIRHSIRMGMARPISTNSSLAPTPWTG